MLLPFSLLLFSLFSSKLKLIHLIKWETAEKQINLDIVGKRISYMTSWNFFSPPQPIQYTRSPAAELPGSTLIQA